MGSRVLDVDLKGPVLVQPSSCAIAMRKWTAGAYCQHRFRCGGKSVVRCFCRTVQPNSGVVGLTKALAAELAPYEVTVNCVCPVGVSTTGMGQAVLDWKIGATGQKTDQILAETAAGIPLKRNATVADVVNAVMFFLSDESAFLTGVVLDVDGGLLSTMPIPGTEE